MKFLSGGGAGSFVLLDQRICPPSTASWTEEVLATTDRTAKTEHTERETLGLDDVEDEMKEDKNKRIIKQDRIVGEGGGVGGDR